MAHTLAPYDEPYKAASAVANWVPVAALQPASALDETVIRAGSINDKAIGMSIATVASPGDPITVRTGGRAKAIAGASLGAGAPVAVGSTNGILVPLLPSGLSTALGSAVGAAGLRYVVGYAVENAVAGDVFTIRVDPGQIV